MSPKSHPTARKPKVKTTICPRLSGGAKCSKLSDTDCFSLKKIIPTGNLQGIDTKRMKNADTLGIRSDLIKRPIESWKELLNPGFKGKAAILNIPKGLAGKKADAACEFINWFLDGWAGAYLNRQGCCSAVLDTAKSKMEACVWAYWMEGKTAAQDIKSPNRDVLAKTGAVHDGGSYEARVGGIACWSAIVDENVYMVQKWNPFVAA